MTAHCCDGNPHLHVEASRDQALRPLWTEGDGGADVGVSAQGPADLPALQLHDAHCPRVISGSEQSPHFVQRQRVDLVLAHVELLHGTFQVPWIQHADRLAVRHVQRAGGRGQEHGARHILRGLKLELGQRRPLLASSPSGPPAAATQSTGAEWPSVHLLAMLNGLTCPETDKINTSDRGSLELQQQESKKQKLNADKVH
ncbi:hypothetical protein JZ751_001896 [Albula glossodonta]|uniref:Uncharacterized protein n=1 Tax=Albula glossodonta TaxID=121402 RepID=A0A8T2PAC1_9TELE|nr:hypothetical protein JZ751_001896 [Albula glossodonta]